MHILLKTNRPHKEPNTKINYYYLLTAIGLMPGGSVTKIGRTYKKWA
jgi:hypothetical protein